MKQTEQRKALPTDSELDAALAQMAEDVPPVPANFHEKWMNAIRAESKDTAPAPEEKPERGSVSLIRWTRILSVAAAFVFLIGGTVLFRNSKKTLDTVSRKAEKTDMIMAAEAPTAGEETEAAAAEEDAVPEDNGTEYAVTEEADKADADTDCDAAPALFMNAAGNAEDEEVYDAVPKAVSGSMAVLSRERASETAADELSAAAGNAAEIYEEAKDLTDMETPEVTQLPAALPAEPVEVTEDTETPDEPEEEPETGFFQNMGAFLTDMGDFLLAALPYLAVLAVPAVITAVIRRKKGQSAG